MDDEIVDMVNDDGDFVRKALKVETHKQGWLHKTVIGYLRYGDDWALVRQASDRQDAGQLVAPVGGHVRSGETEIEGLLREAEEEIGTRNISYKHIGDAKFHRQVIGRDENHLFIVFEISTKDKIKLGNEAVDIERFNSRDLKKALKQNPGNFGDSYFFILEKFYPEYLPDNWVKRWS